MRVSVCSTLVETRQHNWTKRVHPCTVCCKDRAELSASTCEMHTCWGNAHTHTHTHTGVCLCNIYIIVKKTSVKSLWSSEGFLDPAELLLPGQNQMWNFIVLHCRTLSDCRPEQNQRGPLGVSQPGGPSNIWTLAISNKSVSKATGTHGLLFYNTGRLKAADMRH